MSPVSARLKLNVLVVAAVAAVLIAGCGGSSGTAGSAGAATPKPVASAAPAASVASAAPDASMAPDASASQAAAAASDPVCDAWLTPAAIEAALGAPASKINGGLNPNPNAKYPQDVQCQWLTADGGQVLMNVQHDGDDFYVRVKLFGVGGAAVAKVDGVGDIAGFYKDQLYISSGKDPAAIIILGGRKDGQPLDQEALVALAKQIPVPVPAQ